MNQVWDLMFKQSAEPLNKRGRAVSWGLVFQALSGVALTTLCIPISVTDG